MTWYIRNQFLMDTHNFLNSRTIHSLKKTKIFCSLEVVKYSPIYLFILVHKCSSFKYCYVLFLFLWQGLNIVTWSPNVANTDCSDLFPRTENIVHDILCENDNIHDHHCVPFLFPIYKMNYLNYFVITNGD